MGATRWRSYLKRHPAPLSGARLDAFFARLQLLEGSGRAAWARAAGDAYEGAFDVALEDKKSAGAISFQALRVCVVPPWTGAGVYAEGGAHEGAVAQLLHPLVQNYSLGAAHEKLDAQLLGRALQGDAAAKRALWGGGREAPQLAADEF